MKKMCGTTWEQLLDYQEGRLSSTEKQALEQHLATGCPACQETLGWLATTLSALTPPPAPSPEALAYTQGLARLLPGATAAPGRVPLIAWLVSGGAPAVAMARGGGAVQRLYETEHHLITLWDEADHAATRYLIGQVYDRDKGPLVPRAVSLLPTHGDALQAEQEGSEFHLAQVAAGTYLLHCELENTDLYLPGVQVGR